MDADKKKALDMAMHQIEKDFGKGSIMMLGEASAKMNIEVRAVSASAWSFISDISGEMTSVTPFSSSEGS